MFPPQKSCLKISVQDELVTTSLLPTIAARSSQTNSASNVGIYVTKLTRHKKAARYKSAAFTPFALVLVPRSTALLSFSVSGSCKVESWTVELALKLVRLRMTIYFNRVLYSSSSFSFASSSNSLARAR